MRKIIFLLPLVALLGTFASGCASRVAYAKTYPYPPHPPLVIPALITDTYVGYSDGYIWPLVPGNQFVIFEMP